MRKAARPTDDFAKMPDSDFRGLFATELKAVREHAATDQAWPRVMLLSSRLANGSYDTLGPSRGVGSLDAAQLEEHGANIPLLFPWFDLYCVTLGYLVHRTATIVLAAQTLDGRTARAQLVVAAPHGHATHEPAAMLTLGSTEPLLEGLLRGYQQRVSQRRHGPAGDQL